MAASSVNPMQGEWRNWDGAAEAHVLRLNTAPVRLLAVSDRAGAWIAMIVGPGFAHAHPCLSEHEAQRQAKALFWRAFPKHTCNAGCTPSAGLPARDPEAGRVRRPDGFFLFQLGHFRGLGAGSSRRATVSGPAALVTRPRYATGRTLARKTRRGLRRLAAALSWGIGSAALMWGFTVAVKWAMGG